jgi:hypothetical protein
MRKLAVMAVLVLLASALLPSGIAGEGKAAPRAVQRCVLFELFTNVNNTNCADDENATARLAQDYARSRLAILEWFQAGDPLACPEAQERALVYAVTGTPKAMMDGQVVTASGNNESQTYLDYKSSFATHMNTTPSASITGKATLNGLNGTVNTTIGFTANTAGLTSGLTAYCFLYEDGVYYAGSSNVAYHKYVVRRQIGSIPLTNALYRPGENVTANFSFSLSPSWNVGNVGAVVALQSVIGVTSKPVHQSALFQLGSGAATYGVVMSPAAQSLDLHASGTADVSVNARNNGSATDRIDFSLTGPAASWGSLGKSSASLSPGEQTAVSVSIMVPAGTAPGGYMLKVRGASHADPAKADEAVINIDVQEELVYGVALSPSSDTQDATAGDSATFQIKVQNTGTLSDTVDLTVTGDEPSWAALNRASVALPANGEDTVTLTVSVPSDATTGRVDYTVKGTSRADSSKTSTSLASVKVTGVSTDTYGVDVAPKQVTRAFQPGGTATITIGVSNTGTGTDTFDMSKTGDASGWAQIASISIELAAGATGQVAVDINVPSAAAAARYTLTVRATSRGDNTQRSECVMTFDVSLPEEPPRVNTVSATPIDATSKDIVTITASVSGSSIDRVELTYSEGPTTHPVLKMQKSGSTYTMQIGPFKAKTVIRYQVTAYSTTGAKNVSAEQNFTVKSPPQTAQQTPGFGALPVLAVVALCALAVVRRKRRT